MCEIMGVRHHLVGQPSIIPNTKDENVIREIIAGIVGENFRLPPQNIEALRFREWVRHYPWLTVLSVLNTLYMGHNAETLYEEERTSHRALLKNIKERVAIYIESFPHVTYDTSLPERTVISKAMAPLLYSFDDTIRKQAMNILAKLYYTSVQKIWSKRLLERTYHHLMDLIYEHLDKYRPYIFDADGNLDVRPFGPFFQEITTIRRRKHRRNTVVWNPAGRFGKEIPQSRITLNVRLLVTSL